MIKVWRGAERVDVSGVERTSVDCLNLPELCGGSRHLAQMLKEYGDTDKRDLKRLVDRGKNVCVRRGLEATRLPG